MILVTGGTGFIGQALIQHLVLLDRPVRILLRPSLNSPRLPQSIPVEVAVCGIKDERGLRAAMKDVDVIFHLAGSERMGSHADLTGMDVQGTQVLAEIAAESGVDRFFYLSHLGADRASAYPLLKAKALAEHAIIESGLNYTIFRTAPIFGRSDNFTVPLARLLKRIPFVFLIPGEGDSVLQPIWIDDLVTCLGLALDDPQTGRKIFSVGGAEFLSYRQVVEDILTAAGLRRRLISVPPPFLRGLTLFLEQFLPKYALSYYWLDYLSADRTCNLDILPRQFGLMPARFNQKLGYLKEEIKLKS